MPSIFLIGFMASGKSEVCGHLSSLLGMPGVDLDREIEVRAGKAIAEIFKDEGEQAFRNLERQVLLEICQGSPRIVACGGGTPTFSDNMQEMKDSGWVVHLAASLDCSLARAAQQPGLRPLLDRDRVEVEDLYRRRAPRYRQAHLQVQTEGRSPGEVARLIAADVKRGGDKPGPLVCLRERSYPLVVGKLSIPAQLMNRAQRPSKVAIVSDSNVFPLYGKSLLSELENAGFSCCHSVVSAGEKSKSIEVFSGLCNELISAGLDRSSLVIALGGGVVGDLAGYVAASLFRGIAVWQVPTSLLAMTDSAIGGKTGINSPHGKNLIGAFWQPEKVLIDASVLNTLPPREFRAAFGELIKYAYLDADIFPMVRRVADKIEVANVGDLSELSSLIESCAALKAAVVSLDERESNLRATLNLGHTIGHAIEKEAGYGELLHGEAVALGLIASCRVSHRLGLCSAELEKELVQLLQDLGLDHNLDAWLTPSLFSHLAVDKKREGAKLRFITIHGLGDVRVREMQITQLQSLLALK